MKKQVHRTLKKLSLQCSSAYSTGKVSLLHTGKSMEKEYHILLIQLYSNLQFPDSEPLSIEILASALNRELPTVACDLVTLTDQESLIPDKDFDIIGISIPQGTYELAQKLIGELINKDSPPLIVLGHALPTYSPQLFLSKSPEIIVVRGWGEDAFVQVVKQFIRGDFDWGKIPGLAFTKNGKISQTEVTWPDTFTPPVRLDTKLFFPRVESSRGCSHGKCTFCTRPPISEQNIQWMRFSIPEVIDCVEELSKSGNSDFTFSDEDFLGADLDEALIFAERLAKIGNIRFSISIRVDSVINQADSKDQQNKRKYLFEILNEAGLSLVFLGIESLSNSQLNRYGKGVSVEDNIGAINFLNRFAFKKEFGFILFDPLMSVPELIENVRNLQETGIWREIGSLIRQLRVQEGCVYQQILLKRGLLKAYQPVSMDYAYAYADPLIAEIAATSIRWNDELAFLYKLARDINRTDFSQDKITDFIFKLRELNFTYLLSVIHEYIDLRSHFDFDTKNFGLERYRLVEKLKTVIAEEFPRNHVSQELFLYLDKFLTK